MNPSKKSWTRAIWNFLSGVPLATALLLILMLMTWMATLEQVDHGLYDTLRKYFNRENYGFLGELVLPENLGGATLRVPLPSGYIVLALLLVNLTLGGIIRIRKGWRKVGVLIAHFSMVFLLISAGVTEWKEDRSLMDLLEGETVNAARDYYQQSIEIAEIKSPNSLPEKIHLIKGKDIADATYNVKRAVSLPQLPFDMEFTGYVRNAAVIHESDRPSLEGEAVINGFYIFNKKPETTAESNMPACYASVKIKGSNSNEVFILSSGAFHPKTIHVNGRTFLISMQRALHILPFSIRLDKAVAEYYPNTNRPKKFESYVTRIENQNESKFEIKMNEPMRSAGYTLYQRQMAAGMMKAAAQQKNFSQLEVVKNPADQWPRYALYVAAFGLFIHFVLMFTRFTKREKNHAIVENLAPQNAVKNTSLALRVVALTFIIGTLGALFYQIKKELMPPSEIVTISDYKAWDKATIDAAKSMPVQDGGRVKPLDTFASFSMLQLYGNRKMEIKNGAGEKIIIKPTAWMLDCLFHSETAAKLPTFRIDDTSILTNVGITLDKKRDRVSYEQLIPGRDKLLELAQGYEKIDSKSRDLAQKQIIELAYKLRFFESLIGYCSFARSGVELKDPANPEAMKHVNVSTMMKASNIIRDELKKYQAEGKEIPAHMTNLLTQIIEQANFAKFTLLIAPSPDASKKAWRSAGEMIMEVMNGTSAYPDDDMLNIALLENATASAMDENFLKDLQAFITKTSSTAQTRGEISHLAQEVSLNQKVPLLFALIWFLVAIVVVALQWLSYTLEWKLLEKIFFWASCLLTSLAAGYVIYTVVMRSIIMQRPPIGNLYDTIIFIAAVAVPLLLLAEKYTKLKLASSIAPLIGVGLVLLARRFEVGEAKDHMDPLVAVLDSNYWLTTHVICVTAGYAAGLVTAIMSMIWIITRALGLSDVSNKKMKLLTTVTYGTLCITLFLSLVGTILGGIWANDSWGRFWGWDPKENGALMIVLWSLIILHARIAGIIKEWGVHLACAFLACVIGFSWWHVNFLNVGMHNYGFTSGKQIIWAFYGYFIAVILFGIVTWIIEQNKRVR